MNIKEMTALQLSEMIKEGEVTVKEAAHTYLNQIQEKDGQLNAFITVADREKLQQRIEDVQQGIAEGKYTSKLAGVPIAIKDNICTKGMRTTCASKMLESFVPAYHAEVIRRLEAAGMIIIGKTNMDEFAMGSTSETSAFGITRNPWNTEHVPGGSSGGSCVAVAAGEVPMALGSDTGGSIRQPASYCGVTGLKPTYGRVSRYGLIAYASSLDQIGPVGKNVADCAELYKIIAGHDEKDSTSINRQVEKLDDISGASFEGKVIGIPEEYIGEGTDEEVKQAILKAATHMESAGARVEYFSLKLVDYVIPTYYIIACAEASSNLERFDGVKYGYRNMEAMGLHEMYKMSRTEGFGEEVKRRILLGSFVLSAGYYDAYYMKALKTKRLIKNEFDEAFKRYDCILAPVVPTTAPRLGTILNDPLKMYLSDIYTVSVNLCGLPALSMPCGVDSNGLPIGLQLIGDLYQENKILEMAAAYEKIRGGFPSVGDGQTIKEDMPVLEERSDMERRSIVTDSFLDDNRKCFKIHDN